MAKEIANAQKRKDPSITDFGYVSYTQNRRTGYDFCTFHYPTVNQQRKELHFRTRKKSFGSPTSKIHGFDFNLLYVSPKSTPQCCPARKRKDRPRTRKMLAHPCQNKLQPVQLCTFRISLFLTLQICWISAAD